MTDKTLKKLSRQELLELLLEQSDALAQAQEEINNMKAQLETKNIVIEKAGSMAEAALMLNGVFQAADNAATQYLDNIKTLSAIQTKITKKIESEAQARCEKVIEEAKEKARHIIDQAESESIKKRKAADDYLRAATQSAKELLENMQAKAFSEK